MNEQSDAHCGAAPLREISREDARRRRARLLAAQQDAAAERAGEDSEDTLDASLATLILPGG